MKATITIFIISLLVTGCSYVTETQQTTPVTRRLGPERRSTEVEIRQHIVGEWVVADGSDGCWYPKLIIAEGGSLTGVRTNGKTETIGTWELYRTALRVTPTPERFEAARKSGYHLNDWDYYPVIYADTHELVVTPGISMAGRWRYER